MQAAIDLIAGCRRGFRWRQYSIPDRLAPECGSPENSDQPTPLPAADYQAATKAGSCVA